MLLKIKATMVITTQFTVFWSVTYIEVDIYWCNIRMFSFHLYPSHSWMKHALLKCWQISIRLHHATSQRAVSFKLYTDNKKTVTRQLMFKKCNHCASRNKILRTIGNLWKREVTLQCWHTCYESPITFPKEKWLSSADTPATSLP